MPNKPNTLKPSQIPSVQTREEAADFFDNPLGILATGMEPSAAFASLTPKARLFVLALANSGGQNIARAARIAGYNGTDASLQANASRLAANPKVQEALLELAMGLARSSSLLAITELIKMIESSQSEKTKLTAIGKLVALIGMEAPKQIRMEHTVEMKSTKEQIDAVVRMSKELGLDPRKLLGRAGITVDAEFTEVGTSAGLEDLL